MGVRNNYSRVVSVRLDARDPDERKIIEIYDGMLSGRKNDYLRRLLVQGDRLEGMAAGIAIPKNLDHKPVSPSLFAQQDPIVQVDTKNDYATADSSDSNGANNEGGEVKLKGLFGDQE